MNPLASERLLPNAASSGELAEVSLLIEGVELPLSIAVLSVEVSKSFNHIPSARLVIRDGDPADETFAVSEADFFLPGKEVEVQAGTPDRKETIFRGLVVRHSIRVREGNAELIIDCRHACYSMALAAHNQIFVDQDDAAILSALADAAGLGATVEGTTQQQAQIVQWMCTDWDQAILRAEANGLCCLAQDDGTLLFKAPDATEPAEATVLFGATIYQLDAEIDGRQLPQNVKATTWAPADQAPAEVTAANPAWTEAGEPDAAGHAANVGVAEEVLVHGGMLDTAQLQAWADARLLRSRMAKMRGRVQFRGFAVTPGQTLLLQGVGKRFNGPILVTGVRHEISEGRWITDAQFGLDPAWHSQQYAASAGYTGWATSVHNGVHGLQTGLVTQLKDDPASEFRIQVQIPMAIAPGNLIWARLALADAGDERGAFFLPEIGDEVVLGFFHNDPAQAVILGRLHSSAKPAAHPFADENHLKGYISREKLKLTFDDEKKILTLETPGGQKVILDDDAGGIVLEDQHGNQLKLDSDGITLQSKSKLLLKADQDIDVEGLNLTLKAQAQLKAQGSAGIEVSSSAVAKLKGGVVMIN